MKPTPKTWTKDQIEPALPITREELIAFGIPEADIDKGESRGKLKSFGPWQLPVSFTALCMSCVYTPKDDAKYSSQRESETVYGIRTLQRPVQSGYQLEGRVSVNGRKVRGFTSSQLFELPDGKLISVATIHACIPSAN